MTIVPVKISSGSTPPSAVRIASAWKLARDDAQHGDQSRTQPAQDDLGVG